MQRAEVAVGDEHELAALALFLEREEEEREGQVRVVDEELDHVAQRRRHGDERAEQAERRQVVVASGVEAEAGIAGAGEQDADERVDPLARHAGGRVREQRRRDADLTQERVGIDAALARERQQRRNSQDAMLAATSHRPIISIDRPLLSCSSPTFPAKIDA